MLMLRTQVLLYRSIFPRRVASLMQRYLFTLGVDAYQRAGIDDFCFAADIGVRNAIVMLVSPQIYMPVLGYLELSIVFQLETLIGQGHEMVLFHSTELFFPCVRFLLATGLVMLPDFFGDGRVQRR